MSDASRDRSREEEPEPWYRRWFGEDYLELYPHRDREEARRAVELFLERAAVPRGPVLDLACGAGRHLDAFRAAGRRAIGLDLSAPLLREAAGTHRGRLVRGDMRRLPFAASRFAGVTSFFTSFGYFHDPDDDLRVLGEAARVLRPDGMLLLDYLNATKVRSELVRRDEQEIGGRRIRQRRRIDGGVVEKRIEILDEAGEPSSVFHERVRLYGPRELSRLLEEAGFTVEARFGDYDGTDYGTTAPRTILVARGARPGNGGSGGEGRGS